MANKTIKYSKTDPTGTTTTNVFENFEPWRYGEPAIPTELYFLGVGGNGYQQYFNTNGYGVQEINATGSDNASLFEINGKPIRGCVKGTVVTATNILASGHSDVEIWVDDNDIARYKTTDDDNKTKLEKEIKTADGIVPERLGIALVGGGGACGGTKSENWNNNCCEFDTEMPGGGGGGGGVIWGIIKLKNLDKNWKYTITVGTGGDSPGASGKDTTLLLSGTPTINGKIEYQEYTLASAGGGGGGSTGKKSGAVGGVGGTCTFAAKGDNFIYCGQQPGKLGGSYAEVDEGNESQDIGSSVEANEFSITFIPGSGSKAAGDKSHNGIGTAVKTIVEQEGNVYLAVPGGNSYGNGGYPIGSSSFFIPEWGGGGMCWTYDDNKVNDAWCESIWADTADAYIKDSSKARCGAKGGWILFY